jgi:hypothetical protein
LQPGAKKRSEATKKNERHMSKSPALSIAKALSAITEGEEDKQLKRRWPLKARSGLVQVPNLVLCCRGHQPAFYSLRLLKLISTDSDLAIAWEIFGWLSDLVTSIVDIFILTQWTTGYTYTKGKHRKRPPDRSPLTQWITAWLHSIGTSIQDYIEQLRNLARARARWASMRRFLVRDAADPKSMATFYRTVVLYVLLYGSESWVLPDS